ncbi:MAG: hypothetical protein H7122_10490 [Chitinophagaceae bacterium]|nr:hypothetical protein [Chitinophagaceae bacterium]
MKNFLRLSFLLIAINFISCKKAIENKQRDILIDAITNGEWQVQQYVEGTADVTILFYGYRFQFEEQGAVHAKYGGSAEHGTWTGDVSNYSISSQFPVATDPVKKLNGIWKLTDSYWDYVEAEMNTANGKNILHLRKIP